MFPRAIPLPAASVDRALNRVQGGRWLEGGWAILDPQGGIVHVNESLGIWLERGPGELIGVSLWQLLTDRCADWAVPLQTLQADPGPVAAIVVRETAAPAAPPQCHRIERARNALNTFVRIDSILPPLGDLEEATWDEYLRSESARREMFVRLLRAESQLKNLTDRWPGVIFSQRPDFSFRFVSPRIEELTGVSVADWQSQPQEFWQRVHEGDAEELRRNIREAVRSGQTVTTTFRVRHLATGRITYVMEHRQPILSRGGLLLGYEGVWLDVTRQTIAEKRLSSAAWKETLSVVTMGLAHDFGNVMAGIHALTESFLAEIEPEHPFHEGLGLIRKSSQQASQLVHRIINLHQGRTGENNYHNLNDLATDLAELTRKIIPRRMSFELVLCPEPLPVYLDAVEFRQVVINLVLNAVDAMPQTGRLTLRTSMHPQPPAAAHLQGVIPRSPCAVLSVEDTGCGIKAEQISSIFDPFFTTKPLNKGSGLGLYNARLFVEKHLGAISVESVESVGSKFHIWLPQADFTEAEADVARRESVAVRSRILLVGSLGAMLDGTAELLRVEGYHVAVAFSRDEADGLCRSSDQPFAALFVIFEPKDTGLEAWLRAVRARLPALRLVLQIVGGDGDDVPESLRTLADLVIAPDVQRDLILQRLKDVLAA
ncbi:MAG TPA: ATP-binding protein [Methylomirabilota bacterium]|nr:ATP-binding protein [Methylomirabilota bacterium]